MITPATLSDEDRHGLRRLREFAEAHPFLGPQVDEGDEGHPLAEGDGFHSRTRAGFAIGFTIEERQPGRWCRHLSIEAESSERFPPSSGILAIGRELGMALDIFDPSTKSYIAADLDLGRTRLDIIESIEWGIGGA